MNSKDNPPLRIPELDSLTERVLDLESCLLKLTLAYNKLVVEFTKFRAGSQKKKRKKKKSEKFSLSDVLPF